MQGQRYTPRNADSERGGTPNDSENTMKPRDHARALRTKNVSDLDAKHPDYRNQVFERALENDPIKNPYPIVQGWEVGTSEPTRANIKHKQDDTNK